MGISWRDLGVDAGLQGGAAFVVADEVPATLFNATCAQPICPEIRDLYRLRSQTKGSPMPPLTPARCSVQIGRTEGLLSSS